MNCGHQERRSHPCEAVVQCVRVGEEAYNVDVAGVGVSGDFPKPPYLAPPALYEKWARTGRTGPWNLRNHTSRDE